MQVILIERLPNLGNLGDIVTVKPGYGRNYLLPFKKALMLTEENKKYFEKVKGELEKQETDKREKANILMEKINNLELEIAVNCNSEGKLFGSVSPTMISKSLGEKGYDIPKSNILIPTNSFREIGTYEVGVKLHIDLVANIKINIIQS